MLLGGYIGDILSKGLPPVTKVFEGGENSPISKIDWGEIESPNSLEKFEDFHYYIDHHFQSAIDISIESPFYRGVI